MWDGGGGGAGDPPLTLSLYSFFVGTFPPNAARRIVPANNTDSALKAVPTIIPTAAGAARVPQHTISVLDVVGGADGVVPAVLGGTVEEP